MTNFHLPQKCVIIGGGPSATLDLVHKASACPYTLTVGTNYSYKFLVNAPTFHSVVDPGVYPMAWPTLKNYPLVIARSLKETEMCTDVPANLVLLTAVKEWQGITTLENVYTWQLVGAFALSVVCHLYTVLRESVDIYLLGYDFGAVAGRTHFYQDKLAEHPDLIHNGIGLTSFYNKTNADAFFSPYTTISGYGSAINIFNVSVTSKISIFPKLTGDEFLDRLGSGNSEPVDQPKLRTLIRSHVDKYHKIVGGYRRDAQIR